MNLLTDAWIPIHDDGQRKLIKLQDVLCGDEDWQLSLPRDDMEMACLQLMICLAQVIFTPRDAKELKQKIRQPLTEDEYKGGIRFYLDWFDLSHPETPFMQVKGVTADKITPIQKMFIGLPEGNNHAFFNDAGELTAVSQSAAAIALFNQAMNSPSMGGGFKGGFRGSAPITTLISGETLRQTIWLNILHEDSLRKIIPRYDDLKKTDTDKPTWVDPIQLKSSISATDIGLLRGLFWQPAHIELEFSDKGQCQFLGTSELSSVTSFKKEKFVYEIVGQWIHPHSPRFWLLKKGAKEEKYASFTTTAPAWTQMTRFVIDQQATNEGQEPAMVVSQFRQMFTQKPLLLIVGGYRNKQAAILQRRHEMLSLPGGWESGLSDLKEVIEIALAVKTALRNKIYGFAKTTGASGLPHHAESTFYRLSEDKIHKSLRELDWKHAAQEKSRLLNDLIRLSWQIFNDLLMPYQHEPKMILATATARKSLNREFKKIKEGKS